MAGSCIVVLVAKRFGSERFKMFDTCDSCEVQEVNVMFINGSILCYECAVLTADDEEIEEVL